ncbi:MAG: UDP-2,4-diacetamido-2,4,6-trideoxy-beta-L-altropyranose hydrolase [Telmatospirillum sp.]|nr:UDP-2,4-diacetamido-2,4,6-trideoxy-beta-L-altropyranose hydrolase [Telmatospirillum sp.]
MSQVPQSAILRFDASAQIGGGHAMRCRALAAALVERGWACRMAVRRETLAFLAESERGDAIVLEGAVADEPTAIAGALAARADLCVIDHYARDAAYEKNCRSAAVRIMAIDDLAQVPHDCDYLLNQNPGAHAHAYAGLVPAACVLMVDPGLALLRTSFAKLRAERAQRPPQPVRRILVSMGAVDRNALGLRLATALAECLPDAVFDVAPCGDGADDLAPHPRVRRHGFVDDLAELMAAADFAVGAGGTTGLERCALGLPSAIVIVAENQRPGSMALQQAGAALVVADAQRLDIASAAALIADLVRDEARLADMRAAALSLCAGGGAQIVAGLLSQAPFRFALNDALARPAAQKAMDAAQLRLRFARPTEVELLYAWQSDPATRRFSRAKHCPTPSEHRAWVQRYFADSTRGLLIAEADGKAVGSLRLDRLADGTGAEVSIVVAPECRGTGLGQRMLRLLLDVGLDFPVVGHIEPENAPSRAIFLKAGFRQTADQLFTWMPGTVQ